MGKAGEKQKRRPKFSDKKQSERFKEAARELGADEESDALGRIIDQMAKGVVPTPDEMEVVAKANGQTDPSADKFKGRK